MAENEPFKNMIENAYLQQRQMIEFNHAQFKNMIENAYLQQRQMIETNASIMKNYSSIFGNKEVIGNIEKVESHFLNLNDDAKKSMLDQLDLVKDNFLSNAVKIKDGFKETANFDKFRSNSEGSGGSRNESR
ncbi:MAG TPA: hypothetical protein VJR94_09315 [Candidatus Nitrosocosmicus sp.]|nr:hypothetical protein [Candidatus Nitrosocosmicus sp.]